MSRWKRKKKRNKKAKEGGGGSFELVPDAPIVAVCIPSDTHVHAGFCMSLTQMIMHTFVNEEIALGGITIQHVGASILPHSRYMLVKQALRHNATHLLFLDSDMTFPADTLIRLLKHDLDMVGVNALSRRPPYNVTAWIAPERPAMTTQDASGLEKVWRTGLAVVLIKTRVFEALDPPYFNLEFIPEKDQFRGEDYVFFDSARKAGFELYVDHDLSKCVNHMGDFAYNPQLKHMAQEIQPKE